MCLQVIENRADRTAKSTTKEEFIDQFKCIRDLARQKMPAPNSPLFSYDNLSTQHYADLADLGITPAEKLPLGPYMPDAHQIVEHCFAGFKPWFMTHVYAVSGPGTESADLQRLLKTEWANFERYCHEKGSLRRNADDLPVTLEVIKMPRVAFVSEVDGKVRVGSSGGWVENVIS